MSGLSNWFNWPVFQNIAEVDLPVIFPLSLGEKDFVSCDVLNIYKKILTDVAERSDGLSEDHEQLLWDNCLASESSRGLITLLSWAMLEKCDLFLVVDTATGVLRRATDTEAAQIQADYKSKAESAVGVFVSFRLYTRTDMIRIYSALEYTTVAALNKAMNLSKSIQFKVSDLRASTALSDKAEAKAQGKAIATGLSKGLDVMLDAKDIIETATPDLSATNAAIEFLSEKRAFYLGLPCSYITGELNSGLGDTGQADAKAIERGLKAYYVSIFKPVCEALFKSKLTFKSDDFMQIATSIEVLKTFELVSDELMSAENKLSIINRLFGLDPDEKGGPVAEPPPSPPAIPAPPKAPPIG